IGEVMDRHLGAQNPGGGSQGGSPSPHPRAGESPTQSTPTDGRQTSGDNTAQSRPDGTPPRTDAAQPGDRTPPADRAGHGGENRPADGTRRDDQAQPSDGTPRGHEEPAPGQSDPRFRRGNVDDDGNTPPPDEPPARTDPPAGSGLPHQQADWVP